jgi:hypothetical protein
MVGYDSGVDVEGFGARIEGGCFYRDGWLGGWVI